MHIHKSLSSRTKKPLTTYSKPDAYYQNYSNPEEKAIWDAEEHLREKHRTEIRLGKQISDDLINEMDRISDGDIQLRSIFMRPVQQAPQDILRGLIVLYNGNTVKIEVYIESNTAYVKGEVNGQSWPPRKSIEIPSKPSAYLGVDLTSFYINVIKVFKLKVDQSSTRMARLRRYY